MSSEFAKKASDHIPWCKDQNIDYLTAAEGPGLGTQSCTFTVPSPAAFTFAGAGLKDMADANYQVFITDPTTPSNNPTATSRTTKGFTITGATTSDVVDILIRGHFKGALTK